MTTADLIKKIKTNLEEFTPDGVALPFDETYLSTVMQEAAREITMVAPARLITPTDIPMENTNVPPVPQIFYKDSKSYIRVPSDYLRLYEIKFPLWKRSVRQAYPVESPEYRMQENESLAPGYGRPFVGIVDTPWVAGSPSYLWLECGRVENPAPATITPIATYVKIPAPEDIKTQLVDSYCWLCAAKLFIILEQPNSAKMAMDQYVQGLKIIGNS